MADPERNVSAKEDFRVPKKTPWHELAERLRTNEFKSVVITDQPSIPQVLAGFILTQIGIAPYEQEIPAPMSSVIEGYWAPSENLRGHIPLFKQEYSNPTLLTELISTSNLDSEIKRRLSRLTHLISYYRQHSDHEWTKADSEILNSRQFPWRDFHRTLTFYLLLYADDPIQAYDECLEFLKKLLYSPKMELPRLPRIKPNILPIPDRTPPAPIELEIPIIKSQYDEPDKIEYTRVRFDQSRVRYLHGRHLGIIVGGSPNSGKSTFTASLALAMGHLVNKCVDAGLLKDEDLGVGICDLDMSAPTSVYIAEGEQPPRDGEIVWDEFLAFWASGLFGLAKKEYNIVIADLPGGTPDLITHIISARANYSISVERNFGKQGEPWKKFLNELNFSPKPHIVHIHTRFNEPGRVSCVREYESLSLGNKRNFLQARAVNLNRQLKFDDPVVNFTAHVLLFDYLPSQVIRLVNYQAALYKMLQEG